MVPLAPCHLASSSFRNTCAYKKGALPQWWFISSSPLQRAKRQATWINQPTVSFLKCLRIFGGWLVIKMVLSTNQPTNQLFVSTNQHDLPCVFFVRVKSRRDKGDTSGQRSTEPPPERFTFAVLSASTGKNGTTHTTWAPTSYKWSYNPCKWPNKWVTGDIPPINRVITLLITGVITLHITFRGPLCTFRYSSLPGCQIIQNIGES